MALFAATLRALAPLFGLILLGWALKRARILHAAHVPVLNGLVVNVTLPALIFKGLTDVPPPAAGALLLPAALLLVEAAAMAMAYGLGHAVGLPKSSRGALLLTGVFGNTGFIGYPVSLALLPGQFPLAILLDQFGMTIALYLSAPLIGGWLGDEGHGGSRKQSANDRRRIAGFFRSPLFVAAAAGLILHMIPWPPLAREPGLVRDAGGVLGRCLTYLGQGTTPVVLLALGVALRVGAARDHALLLGLACLLKLLVCPLAMWGLCRLLGLHGPLLAVGVLQAAMPTAVMAAVLSGQHEMAGDGAVGVVFASTLASAVTIPVALSLLH